MFQALPKTIAFEEFLNWKPDGGGYELHDGADDGGQTVSSTSTLGTGKITQPIQGKTQA